MSGEWRGLTLLSSGEGLETPEMMVHSQDPFCAPSRLLSLSRLSPFPQGSRKIWELLDGVHLLTLWRYNSHLVHFFIQYRYLLSTHYVIDPNDMAVSKVPIMASVSWGEAPVSTQTVDLSVGDKSHEGQCGQIRWMGPVGVESAAL